MTLQSEAGRLHGHWRTTVTGYDATNARLTDLTGNGNHLPKIAGTPDFTKTFDSVSGTMEMLGSVYFGGKTAADMLPSKFTLVMPMFLAPPGGTTINPFYATLREYAASGDPAWQSPTAITSGVGADLEAHRIRINGDFYGSLVGSLTIGVGGTYTFNDWNVFQMVVDPDGAQIRARIGTGAWSVVALPNQYQIPMIDEARFGWGETPLAANSAALSQIILYSGVAPDENPTEYGALIAALVADPKA